jgi:hypothetical protein
MAEWAERPLSLRRTGDVMVSGLVARLSGAGLIGPVLDGPDQARAGLASLVVALAAFLVLGVSMWAQLTIGWQWSAPDAPGTVIAVVAMTVTVGIFALLALAAAAPVVWSVVRTFRQRTAAAQGLGRPAMLVAAGLTVVIVGARHFGNGWPGTGGHPWAHQGLVPGGVAAFSWASTLSVSSYWMHPLALSTFPAAEVAWMIASPLALTTVAVGCAKVVRRVQLSPRALQFEVAVGRLAVGVMAVFVVAAGLWVLRGGAGPHGLFTTGAIDRVALVAMVATFAVAVRAVDRTPTGPIPRPR